MKPFSIHSWPQAILHVDGDAFFASCEQAVDTSLRGKPVVTGAERGIASAMSYEAKARGVKRAMRFDEIKRVCPECIILPSNYELYSLMSLRMYEIVRKFTPTVEEYSIDECFADITGQRRPLGKTYAQIVVAVKEELETNLGISFSVGLAPTKTLAKVASNFRKPSGAVVISGKDIERYLRRWPVGKVWGIGRQTNKFLYGQDIRTAFDFARQQETWINQNAHKPLREIWQEIRGEIVHVVNIESKRVYKSIQKTKTFSPSSGDRATVLSELSKNIENACIKARRYRLRARKVSFFLKNQAFRFSGFTAVLDSPIATPELLVGIAEERFEELFRAGELYRATGVTLHELEVGNVQQDLFGESAKVERFEELHGVMDEVDARFGKHTIFLGSSFQSVRGRPTNRRNVPPERHTNRLKGETARKRLSIPHMGKVS